MKLLGTEKLPSRGSITHADGRGCQPCAKVHTGGCNIGEECPYCHLCEVGSSAIPTWGSIYHYSMRKHCKPCVDFKTGACKDGADCKSCHLCAGEPQGSSTLRQNLRHGKFASGTLSKWKNRPGESAAQAPQAWKNI